LNHIAACEKLLQHLYVSNNFPLSDKNALGAGADPGGAIGVIFPPKTYECNFIHHDFLQIGKQNS